MINHAQFDSLIVTPVLAAFALDTEGMHMLINGTVAHESKGGTYIAQLRGPALGICQMEAATHDSIWAAYLPQQTFYTHKLMTLCSYARMPKAQQLTYDLLYATAMCALLYKWRMDYHKVSSPTTLEQAADIWKRFYNTTLGSGTVDEFIADYKAFVELKVANKKKVAS